MISKPLEDLYIYLLSGTVTTFDEDVLGDTFIGNWVEGKNSFLFFSAPAQGEVDKLLNKRRELRLEDNFHFTYEDWQGGGLDTLDIGPFMIIPPWMNRPATKGRVKILLDPGVVFGNCLHPTTRNCLEAIALLACQSPLGRVLDLGTGTGILAVAVVLLGAEEALGVDFNPLCVKTASNNIALNGLNTRARAVQGKAEDFSGEPADLVVANIQYDVIRDFLNKSASNLPRTLIVSGQMRSQCRDLKEQLKSLEYSFIREWDHDMTWYTVLVKRP